MVTNTQTAVERSSGFTFDPDRLAYLEVAGLRAYYDHKWMRMLGLVVALMHLQFDLSWPRAIQAAYYTTRASVAWAPKDNKPQVTRRYIRKFYKLAAKHGSGFKFDPRKAGDLEFVYWDLHRRYSGRPYEEKQPYVQCLAELHSELFDIPLEDAWPSAENRAHATDHIDEVTGKRSTDIETDWRKAEEYLRAAYRSVRKQV